MIYFSISLPHKHVYRKDHQIDRNPVQLKEYLLLLCMRALESGDVARVELSTDLLTGRRLRHV
jgi:hypothetical protein